jgi:hypothetical protein
MVYTRVRSPLWPLDDPDVDEGGVDADAVALALACVLVLVFA